MSTKESRRKVLSVGQCPADDKALRQALQGRYAVEVVAVDSAAEALRQAQQGGWALILVNRVFDVDDGSGIELIRALKSDEATAQVPVMLVSNMPDAQATAVATGAVPGFGKSALTATSTFEALDPYLA